MQIKTEETTYIDWGPYLELRLPFYWKLRGTYVLSEGKSEEGLGGKGFKVGLTFQLFRYLSLNVDYISVDYDNSSFNPLIVFELQ